MWGIGADAPSAPAERMGGGAYRRSGAGRRPVTSDSRVRSSRGGRLETQARRTVGAEMLSPQTTQKRENRRAQREKNRKHTAFDLTCSRLHSHQAHLPGRETTRDNNKPVSGAKQITRPAAGSGAATGSARLSRAG